MTELRTDMAAELRGLEIAAGWPEALLAELATLAELRSYPAGALVFREGEQNAEVHFITSGRIALEMSVPARGRVRLLTLSKGELLGWSPLVGNREMTATAVAVDESRLVAFSGAALLSLCERDHELGFAVMRRVAWALSRRLTATRLQLLDLFSHVPPQFRDAPVLTEGS